MPHHGERWTTSAACRECDNMKYPLDQIREEMAADRRHAELWRKHCWKLCAFGYFATITIGCATIAAILAHQLLTR